VPAYVNPLLSELVMATPVARPLLWVVGKIS